MIQICRKDKEGVYRATRTGKIDAAEMSSHNLVDDIILAMEKHGVLDFLPLALEDKHGDNRHIPFHTLLCLGVAAKLKLKTSLTNLPFAVTGAELLAELGWNIRDNEWDVNEGFFWESVMRKFLAKHSSEEWVPFYNHYVQDHLMEHSKIQPSIHILDCTKIPVNLDNDHYEESSVVTIGGDTNLASSGGYWMIPESWRKPYWAHLKHIIWNCVVKCCTRLPVSMKVIFWLMAGDSCHGKWRII